MCGVVGVVNIVLAGAIVDSLRANGDDGGSGCYMLSKCVDVFSGISDTQSEKHHIETLSQQPSVMMAFI